MYDRVLIPLDGSTFSAHALLHAAAIAERTGATLQLALVHTPVSFPTDQLAPAPPPGEWEAEYRDREKGYLVTTAERLRGQGHTVEVELRDGEVGRELTRLSESADLVVMATHGRGGLERAWLGSVADSLVRHATTPVLLIRPGEAEEEHEDARATVPFPPRRILAATDGSAASLVAVDQAAGLARLFDVPLTLLRVVAFPGGLTSPYIPHTAEMDRVALEEGTEAAREWLANLAGRFEDVDTEPRVTQAYHAARGILNVADQIGADLIAVGTERRTVLRRVVLGSTADKIVRASAVPVLVAHEAEE